MSEYILKPKEEPEEKKEPIVMEAEVMTIEVRGIGNYYGGLYVKSEVNGKYYWGIEDFNDLEYKEIPKSLYDEIIKYNESKN